MVKFHIIIQFFITVQLFLPNIHSQAQELKFDHITTEEHGLPDIRIKSILQDYQGYLWLGIYSTAGGLVRYDGYNFKTYNYSEKDATTLSDRQIECLYEDTQNRLWIGTKNGGLNRFNRKTETFLHFKHNPADSNSLGDGQVLAIYEERDKPGMLWIGTSTGLYQMTEGDGNKCTFIRYRHNQDNKKNLSQNAVYAICQDSSGMLWVGTRNGLNRFDPLSGKSWFYLPDPGDSNNNIIHAMINDGDSLFWLGTLNGLSRFNLKTMTFTNYQHAPGNPHSLSHNTINAVFKDLSGIIWIATSNGLNRLDPKNNIIKTYHHDPDDPHSLNDNWLLSIYQDRSGVLWIGTSNSGLNKLNPRCQSFKLWKHQKNTSNSIHDEHVQAIHIDRSGKLWIGTSAGLDVFDKLRQSVSHYQNDPNRSNSLSHDNVLSILEDHAGRIWIATYNGLNRFNLKTEAFIRYWHNPLNPNSLSNDYIYCLHEDRNGALWAGTHNGLNKLVFHLDKNTGEEHIQITRYYPDPENTTGGKGNRINIIYEDQQGILWLGTYNGLVSFNQTNGIFKYYRHDPRNPHSLSSHAVYSICEDRSNVLWIGSVMLDKLDRKTNQFKHYKNPGKFGTYVFGIQEDKQGNLWFVMGGNLQEFNPKTEVFTSYDPSDGLMGYEFFAFAYDQSEEGEMFYGGRNGFNSFFPEEIQDNIIIPPVVFTNFKVLGQNFPGKENIDTSTNKQWKNIDEDEEIILSYNENTFNFEFAALVYINPDKNQYAYKLQGQHDAWIHLGTQRTLTFVNLEPGEYVLQVKGSNKDGIWNEQGASMRIIITPPWWRTKLAYGVYVLLVAFVVYGLRRFELNRTKLRNELKMQKFEAQKLQEIDNLKSRFFANISHEFRTPLTLIIGPLEKILPDIRIRSLKEQLQMMLRNSRQLLHLINQLLDFSKLEASSMPLKVKSEDIVQLLKEIVQAFASLAECKRITLNFYAKESAIMVFVDRDKIEKIVSNLLSNAFKFTPEDGEISITISKIHGNQGDWSFCPIAAEIVEITVTDTGIGISKDEIDYIFDRFYQSESSYKHAKAGTGIGLALTKELVELHKGRIFVYSKLEQGTTFTIHLPLGKDHLQKHEIVEESSTEEVMYLPQYKEILEGTIQTTPLLDKKTNEKLPILLIVEDNSDVRQYIRNNMESAYQILEAEDGKQGFSIAAEQIPDLIISDIMMPQMDGFELCEKLKTDERTSHIPVILLTARADGESKIHGLETGADDYIIKPFDVKELTFRVKNLIEQRLKLRQRFSQKITIEPEHIAITSADARFLQRAMSTVNQHLTDPEFNVEQFVWKIGMSHMQLHRKLRALINQSAVEFIRSMRLKRAAQLLQQQFGSVTEVAFEVGFINPSYFSECFRKQFGITPSEYSQKPIK